MSTPRCLRRGACALALLVLSVVVPAVHPAGALTPNEEFVTRLYQDFALREPDADELLWYATALGGGSSRASVATSVIESEDAVFIFGLGAYGVYLDRVPTDPEQAAVDVLVSAGNFLGVETSILAGTEYWQLAGSTNSGFVQALYLDVLDRTADGPGLAFWTSELAGGRTRTSVATALIKGSESATIRVGGAHSPSACATVDLADLTSVYAGSYCIVLDRLADSTGLAHWTGQLQTTGNLVQLWISLASSLEYYNL